MAGIFADARKRSLVRKGLRGTGTHFCNLLIKVKIDFFMTTQAMTAQKRLIIYFSLNLKIIFYFLNKLCI